MSIQTEINRLENAKIDLKKSIENKGVVIPEESKIDSYSDFVDQIELGTNNYENLTNLPKINNVELKGNKTLYDLGIQNIIASPTQPENQQVGDIWYEIL